MIAYILDFIGIIIGLLFDSFIFLKCILVFFRD